MPNPFSDKDTQYYLFGTTRAGEPTPGQSTLDKDYYLFGTPRKEVGRRVERDEDPGILSEFGKGVGRGIESEKALLSAAGGQVAGLVGAEELSSSAMQTYDEIMTEVERRPAAIGRVEDIQSPGDFALWASSTLGEQVPVIAGIIAAGGIVGLVARIGVKVGSKQIAKEALRRATIRGSTGGAFAFTSALGTGEVAGELREVDEDRPGLSLAFGTAIGALDLLPVMTVAKQLGLGSKFSGEFVRTLSSMSRGKQAAVMGPLLGVQEAGTETLQEVLTMTARTIVDKNFDILGEEGQSRLLNAAAGGLLVGGGIGAGVSLVAPMRPQQGSLEELADDVIEDDDDVVAPLRVVPQEKKEKKKKAKTTPVQKAEREAEIVEAKRVKDVVSELGIDQIDPSLDPEAGRGFEQVLPLESEQEQVLPLESEQEVSLPPPSTQETVFPLPVESRESVVLLEDHTVIPKDEGHEKATTVLSKEEAVEKAKVVVELEKRAEKEKARRQKGSELTVREKERLERLREKERGEKALTKREQEALKKLQEKEQALAIKAGEAQPVIGFYAEDDAGNFYGPFQSPKEAEIWSSKLQGKRGAVGMEVESIPAYNELVEENFNFKLVEDAEALAEAMGILPQIQAEIQGEPRKAVAEGGPRTGEGWVEWGREASRISEEFKETYPAAPKIIVVRPKGVGLLEVHDSSADPITIGTQEKVWQEVRSGRGVHYGFPDPSRNFVYINLSNVRTKEQLWRTLLHEVLVHDGLRKGLTKAEKEGLLRLIARDVDLTNVALEYKLDLTDETQTLVAAEEYMARLAENPGRNPTLWRKILIRLRQIFRRWFPQLRITDEELRVMIQDMDIAYRVRLFGKERYQGLLGAFSPRAWTKYQKELKGKLEGSVFMRDGEPQTLWAVRGRRRGIYLDSQDPRVVEGRDKVVPVHVAAKNVLDLSKEGDREKYDALVAKAEQRDLWAAVSLPEVELKEAGYDGVIDNGEFKPVDVEKQVWQALNKPLPFRWERAIPENHPAVSNVASVMRAVKEEVELSADGEQVLAEAEGLTNVWKLRAMKFFLTPLQIAKNIPLDTVQRYLQKVEEFWNTKMSMLVEPEQIVSKWRQMGKERANRLAKAIFEITEESTKLKRRLLRAELQRIFEANKLDKESMELYFQIDTSFRNLIPRIERSIVRTTLRESLRRRPTVEELDAVMKAEGTAIELANEIGKIVGTEDDKHLTIALRLDETREQMANLKNRNYFPQQRFGQFSIAVVSKIPVVVNGKKRAKNRLIAWETAETRRAQLDRAAELKRLYGNVADVRMGKIENTEFALLGFPPQMLEAMKQELGLSNKQRKVLEEIFIRTSPGKRFLRSLTRRKGVAGYSTDAMRAFASYMQSAANNIARMEHRSDLLDELQVMRSLEKGKDPETNARLGLEDTTGLGEIRDYFSDHYQYLMNPGNDLAKLRAFGFLWYLGALPKSAFVNLTQVPMVTYPWLAAKYGDGAAVAGIAKAYKDVTGFMLGKTGLLSKDEQEMFTRGMEEGWINESLATELAAISESPTLLRILPGDTGHTMLNKASFYGSWLFHKAETYNRQVAALAAFRLALRKDANVERANGTAKAAVQSTQYEYAKWNRAAFMRGKASVFFLFWQYMQHSSFLAFGGEGKGTAIRLWMMLLMMAGMQGLPFAENAMDLFDFVARKVKGLFGSGDPHSDVRNDIRELVQELGVNPDLAMHGLSRYYGLGPFHVLEAMGVPVPNTDVSGSLSMGRVIPGIEDLTGMEKNPDQRLAKTLVEAGGPVVGIGYNLFKLAYDQHPDSWKAWERAMPSVVKAGSKAIRWAVTGEERLSSGAVIHDFEDMPSRAEAIGQQLAQAAGFAPTELTQKYEIRNAQEGVRTYYLTRRALLLQNYGYAYMIQDREGMADAREAIRKFNKDVPHRALALTQETLKASLKARRQGVQLQELGLPREKSLRVLYRDVGQSFQ